MSLSWAVCAILVSTVILSACATVPPTHSQRALYGDLYQIVATRERVGWLTDEHELKEAEANAYQSVCQVPAKARTGLLGWLDNQVKANGGPVEPAYKKNGNSLDGLEHALRLERIGTLLERTHNAASEKCPFWLQERNDFAGVQADDGRFVVLLGTLGGLAVFFQDGEFLLGGGGGARIIPAYGFNETLTVGLGLEAGGQGNFSSDEGGDRKVAARLIAGVPLVFRFHSLSTIFDVETTMITRVGDDSLSWPPGFRVAFAVGLKTIRVAGILPIGGGWIGYEYLPASDGFPDTHTIRIGTRVGVDWDP